jgi:hypothetical protein
MLGRPLPIAVVLIEIPKQKRIGRSCRRPQEKGFSSSTSLHTPPAVAASAANYDSILILSRIAKVLGRLDDARTYDRSSRNIQGAFNQKFLNLSTHQYATGSQSSNAIPLSLGVVPLEQKAVC